MERGTSDFEKLLSQETFLLRNIKSAAAVTLITYDVSIPVSDGVLAKTDMQPDGWKLITSKELPHFASVFSEATGRDLKSIFQNPEEAELGGAMFIALVHFALAKPEIKEVVCIAPIGRDNGDEFNRVINLARREKQARLVSALGGRLVIHETVSPGITSLILCLFQDDERSMALMKDPQEVEVDPKLFARMEKPNLLMMDARDFSQLSYFENTIKFAMQPQNMVMVGLGTDKVLPKMVGKIRALSTSSQGEIGLAGNRAEVSTLLKSWDRGVRNLSELILDAKLRFLLETDGKNGANVNLRIGQEVYSASYLIPAEEVYDGNCKNAGDVFSALTLAGLTKMPPKKEKIEIWLEKILEGASRGTLKFLQLRGK